MTVPIDIRHDWVARLVSPRPLRFTNANEGQDLPAHVRAGSGLRRWGGHLVIVQDDVNALALVDLHAGVVPLLLPASADGLRQFSERRGNKAEKMDLEGCLALPDGRLLAIASGSTPAREQLVIVDAEYRVRVVQARPLFERLRSRPEFSGSELNVEGAVVVGDRLRLFQRGNGAVVDGRAPSSAVGDLDLEEFLRWLDHDEVAPGLIAITRVELGHVRGVPFCFTDATALPDGRVVFLAGAEDSPDTYRDGVVLGTRVGLLDGEHVELAEILDASGGPSLLKLEGVDFVAFSSAGGIELVVVADMDNPDMPAILASLHWGPP